MAKHVQQVRVSKARRPVDKDGKTVKDATPRYRLVSVPVPAEGSTLSEYAAELEQDAPGTAMVVLRSLRTGLPLAFGQKLFADNGGKVTDSKAKDYVLSHIAEFDTTKAGWLEAAIETAKTHLGSGEPTSTADDVSEDDAEIADKAAGAKWDKVLEAAAKRYGL